MENKKLTAGLEELQLQSQKEKRELENIILELQEQLWEKHTHTPLILKIWEVYGIILG